MFCDFTEVPKVQVPSSNKSLMDLFKPKEGSWECQGCYQRNGADTLKCPSCETVKPGTTQPVVSASLSFSTAASSSASGFSSGFSFAAGGGFKFSAQPQFGLAVSGAATTTAATTTTTSTTSADVFNFSLKSTTASAATGSSPTKADNDSDNEYYEEPEESDNIHFEPVIPLPDKIEVKTGEEDEEVVYCHRAKLMRLSNGEWKERGIGDVKILRHKATAKSR